MRSFRLLLLNLLIFGCCYGYSQELKVTEFTCLERDITAREEAHRRLDINEDPCAIVRVSVAHVHDYRFESSHLVGDVVYKSGEALVYLAKGAKSLTIESDRFGMMKYDFPTKLAKQTVYKLTLKLVLSDDKKTRTLVMPVMGLGSVPSYGAMIGFVKKTGIYAKVKYNFKNFSSDLECGDSGHLLEGGGLPWYSGNTEKTRFAVTGGLIQRLWRPFYLYAGAGYGVSYYGWETVDGEWIKNADHSYSGFEVDFGCIFRIKNVAFSAGYQTNQFKYHEATVGLGFMF